MIVLTYTEVLILCRVGQFSRVKPYIAVARRQGRREGWREGRRGVCVYLLGLAFPLYSIQAAGYGIVLSVGRQIFPLFL